MKITRVVALAVILASGGVAMSQAQSLRNAGEPAEFPPRSYKGTQYVDSRGCVFVRAGIGGDVSWIPRVSRSRNQICGQTPSNAGSVASAAPQAKPVQITLDAPTPAAAAPKRVARVAAKPTVRKPLVAAAKPRQIQIARPAPIRQAASLAPVVVRPAPAAAQRKVVRVQPRSAQAASSCTGASAISQKYLGRSSSGLAVRCGPQTQNHINGARQVATAVPRVVTNSRPQVAYANTAGQTISGATRVAPKHVVLNRQNTQNLPIPNGYRPVWSDDRLNPHRAEQSLAGQALVKLVWTQTVPRRLVNQATGRDVTASTPLVYPYVDVATQTRDLGKVTIVNRGGQVLKRIQRNSYASATVRQPVVSSRSVPVVRAAPVVRKAAPVAAAARTIQVGTYDQQNSAQTVAKRIQRMGLPVRIGKYTRGGQTYRIVLAGPFGSDAGRALSKLRASGFQNATFR